MCFPRGRGRGAGTVRNSACPRRAGACPRREVPIAPIQCNVGNGLDRSAGFWQVSFSPAGAAGRPGYPGGGRRLVHPSGGRFFPLVRKESEERHANGKGFLQSRPSLWNPILRNLRAALALLITVREPGLRPCRAFVIFTGNRGGGEPPPYEDRPNFTLACRERS